jgi:hypothetical protein
MTASWAERLQSVEVIPPRQAGTLQVFGLRWQSPSRLAYRTLDEGLTVGELAVTEQTQPEQVQTIRVVNRAPDPAFLLAGEQLVGAKQNRVLNASVLVAGQTTLAVPVSCVEAGRWQYRSAAFASAGTLAHGALRRLICRHTGESYRAGATPALRQTEVWHEVARKLTTLGTVSVSGALQQAYIDYRGRLAADRLPAPEGASGAAFSRGGRLLGVDLFDQPSTLKRLWSKLVQSYALDALGHADAPAPLMSPAWVRRWLRRASQASAQAFASIGLGQDVRLWGERLVGAALVLEDWPIHLELFDAN